MFHLCAIAEQLKGKDVALKVLDQTVDTSQATGVLLFQMLGAIAEFEQTIRKERQMEGIAAAQTRGVRFGREPGLTPEQVLEVQGQRAAGVLIKTLMQEYHISKSALYRYLAAAPQCPAQAEAAD
jgi:DNA invertase Pin-like site-specific DNA recombinase